jgi:hypothetical protein
MTRTTEQHCLLLLSRGELSADEQTRARALLAEALDWPAIAGAAEEHGVLPLVTRNLRWLGWPHVPATIRGQMEQTERLSAARNRLLARGLAMILEGFARTGIPAIPLKGVALAEALHGDVGLRVCADVDVLVPRHAVGRALALLEADGFRGADRYEAGAADLEWLLRSNMEHCLVSPPPGLRYIVELHWDLAWRWGAGPEMVDRFWADARPGTVLGAPAWLPSPEWQLLYLAFHAARHRWGALKWLVDVHEICARGSLDWTRVDELARRFGLARALALTLGACRALLGTPLPPEHAAAAPPRRLRVPDAAPVVIGGWREAVSAAWLLSRSTDRVRYLGRLLQPTLAEWSLIRLPSSLRFLYYGLRPLRLGLASGRAMARAGRNRLGP